MTNKEVLIQTLQNFNEDEEFEKCIDYFIICPNVNGYICRNYSGCSTIRYHSKEWFQNCSECKRDWLLQEYDKCLMERLSEFKQLGTLI